ncbi:hypothetical protein FRB96_002034 [Tulasnella sp. 330]|nr:hypothetical protein FRB96_002034 [Tulasnella sp. 330]KAG8870513.1 hypothetical protein FRB97_009690 [Tulasnella sp. 331]
MLVIGQADATGQVEIGQVKEELRRLKQLIPNATILEGDEGTREAVLDALKIHKWAHFACHGHQDTVRSNFSLFDGPLDLIDIVRTRLPHAEFAMLSACHSAAGDENTPDEAIHLAGGMQFAGFRSVVGTMWGISDIDGPLMAESFYKSMMGEAMKGLDCRNAAKALSAAVMALRRSERGIGLERWIPFVHFGV